MIAMFRRLKGRDPEFDFLYRFGDPEEPSAGTIPATNYPHLAINAVTQIRVVQVLPGAFEDEICCQLGTKTLTDAAQASSVQFSALSYAWGGFVNPGYITLNETSEFPVSQNLYCFLQRLRSMNQTRWLWIDQICINQHDKKEKSLQVPMMTDIYTQATEVIVWLGDHAPGSQSSHSISKQLERIVEYTSFGRSDSGLCWWRRLWVLQEYSLASKEPVVQIGSEQIPWQDICQFIDRYTRGAPSVFKAADSTAVLSNEMIDRISAVRRTPHEDRTLLTLSWVFPQLICFDPRDKIYGLLGILAPGIKTLIKPDYERAETKTVFSHATYAEISYTKSLAFVALARHKPITNGLPSWAVDFVYPQDFLYGRLIPILMKRCLEPFQKPPRSWTRAAPQTDVEVNYNTENESLTVAGLDLDQILFAFPIIDVVAKGIVQVTSRLRSALAASPLTSRVVLKREEREFRRQILAPLDSQTAYERLLNGEEAHSSPLVYKHDGIRRILAETIMEDWEYRYAYGEVECIEDALAGDVALPAALDGYLDHLAGDFMMSGSSSSFYVTSKGFVGVGPRHMRSGDRIVLPFGSKYPMLLRLVNDSTWSFLGFVHVTGIGSNQLWRLLPSLNLRQQHYVVK